MKEKKAKVGRPEIKERRDSYTFMAKGNSVQIAKTKLTIEERKELNERLENVLYDYLDS